MLYNGLKKKRAADSRRREEVEIEVEGGKLREIDNQEAEQISGGKLEFPDAPRRTCPACMSEWGGIVFMECYGQWTMHQGDFETTGYSYTCPSCGHLENVEV